MQLVWIINCFSMRIWCLLFSLTMVLNYFQSLRCGTTGVVTFIRGNMLHVAWVGDSQVMLVRKGQAVELMKPHKPDREVCMVHSTQACPKAVLQLLGFLPITAFNLNNSTTPRKKKYRKPLRRWWAVDLFTVKWTNKSWLQPFAFYCTALGWKAANWGPWRLCGLVWCLEGEWKSISIQSYR